MLWSEKPAPQRPHLLGPQADPRLRRILSQWLENAPGESLQRLSWVFWLLRTRQPKRVLVAGKIDQSVLLMAAAALSLSRSGRLFLNQAPEDIQALSSLTQAGLDWVLHRPQSRDGAGSFDAAVLCASAEELVRQARSITPRLSAGALIIGMCSPCPNEAAELASTLVQIEPGLESLVMAPEAMPLITMIWRGH